MVIHLSTTSYSALRSCDDLLVFFFLTQQKYINIIVMTAVEITDNTTDTVTAIAIFATSVKVGRGQEISRKHNSEMSNEPPG